ncbi:MAG: DUF1585 domain-containing protein, partial [Rubripirellula sp.]
FLHKDYRPGQVVDCSGITDDGWKFNDIRDFKAHLLNSKKQVARNLISKLISYSTGAEIQVADREVVERILDQTDDGDLGLREIIHQVVHCRMFRER